jgi:hypothetical protein
VQELVSKGKHHNWRSVAAFVAVGIVLLALIIVAIVFLAGGSANDKRAEAITSEGYLYGGSSISLEDVIEGKFSPKGFNGTWISGEARNRTLSIVRVRSSLSSELLCHVIGYKFSEVRINVLPPSSGSESKSNKKLANSTLGDRRSSQVQSRSSYSSHYILLRECFHSVFMLIHLHSFYGFCFKMLMTKYSLFNIVLLL